MAVTRLGLYGGPRSPYGSFSGKSPAPITLTIEAAPLTFTGGDVALNLGLELTIEAGTLTFTGQEILLRTTGQVRGGGIPSDVFSTEQQLAVVLKVIRKFLDEVA